MDTIIKTGEAQNAVNTSNGKDLNADPTPRRFVTYTNALGAVHTIIVDVEHIAKDGEQLLKWFDKTRATITHVSRSTTATGKLTPGEVLAVADDFLKSVGGAKDTPPANSGDQSQGGA